MKGDNANANDSDYAVIGAFYGIESNDNNFKEKKENEEQIDYDSEKENSNDTYSGIAAFYGLESDNDDYGNDSDEKYHDNMDENVFKKMNKDKNINKNKMGIKDNDNDKDKENEDNAKDNTNNNQNMYDYWNDIHSFEFQKFEKVLFSFRCLFVCLCVWLCLAVCVAVGKGTQIHMKVQKKDT